MAHLNGELFVGNNPIDYLNLASGETRPSLFCAGSMSSITSQADQQCREDGARKALEFLYCQLYKQLFINDPTPKLSMLVNMIDERKISLKRSYVFITIRPLFSSVEKALFRFKQYCDGISTAFRFIDGNNKNNCWRWETVKGKRESVHFHGIFKLRLGYSPAQMRNQITTRVKARSWFLPQVLKSCHVRKVCCEDYKTVKDYVLKDDKDGLPPPYIASLFLEK